jgi:hypothetical protein
VAPSTLKKYVAQLGKFNEFMTCYEMKESATGTIERTMIVKFTVFMLEELELSVSYVESVLAGIQSLLKMV